MSLRFFCFLFLSMPLIVSGNQWSRLSSLLPKGTQVSYMVVDPANDHIITQSQPSLLRTPASMQKLLTATAAKLYLGDTFSYQTVIEGQKKLIKNNQYQGDLRFHFVGDPTLLRADIYHMLIALNRLGIKKISGDLLLNQSHFSGYQWSNGQAWNDLGVCYTAPSSAIIINKNCVLGNLSLTSRSAKKARLFIPDYEPVEVSSDVAVVTKEQKRKQFCALEITRNSHNHYHLWGCMVSRAQPLPLSIAVNDPFSYAREIIASELVRAGIILTGSIALDNGSAMTVDLFADTLVSHQSPILGDLLQIMMKDSDNLIADSLFKTLGAAYFHTAGNFRNGGQALKLILKTHGIDLENAYLADGSGLSRHNLMSAELFMAVLKYIYKHDDSLKLLASFSVAGVDGTLEHHHGVHGRLFNGKIIAKTGSMRGVANLLGVLTSPQGERLFVLILNGYNLPERSVDGVQEKRLEAPKYIFQQAFFKTIMNAT